MSKNAFGIIVSTRSFFPSHLVKTAKEQIASLMDELGYPYFMVTDQDTEHGAILTYDEAKICAELFRAHRDEIGGVVVIMPNFGEELGIAEAIQLSELNVPVLIQACDDEPDKMDMANRRDAFCGKISLCNNLYQRGIPYTLTQKHTCGILSAEFREDLTRFASVCNIVNGMKGARIAMIGARPLPFNTVRFSEKILQKHGIAVQTVDLSEILSEAVSNRQPQRIEKKLAQIRAYGTIPESISEEVIDKQARLCLAIEDKVAELQCDASTVLCWDGVENHYGCAACLAMAMMGDEGKPSACESDVLGAVSMLAARLAAGTAPALMDWNNNISDQSDECICLHCSNFPKSFFQSEVEIECLDVLGSTLGKANCFGACKGRVASGDMTFIRLTTDDARGRMKAYVGEGSFLPETSNTKGGVAHCRVDGLQALLRYICNNGFEHHVCFVRGHVADLLEEALRKYMGIEVYRHKGDKA